MSQIYGKIVNKDGLSFTHFKLIELVGREKEVLELGASTGYLTEKMGMNNCQVDIVEIDEEDVKKAKRFARRAYTGTLDNIETIKKIAGQFDVIVASNILEHLVNPNLTLEMMKNKLKKDGEILIALPNIACWAIRKDLFFKGKFDYHDTGILDKTHLRFFTYNTGQNLVSQSGFRIKSIIPTETSYPLKFRILKVGFLGTLIDRFISNFLIKLYPNLFVSHLIIVAAH